MNPFQKKLHAHGVPLTRGDGVFDKSISAIKKLNAVGHGSSCTGELEGCMAAYSS